MTDITLDELPQELRPGVTFEQAVEAPPLPTLPRILDGNQYTGPKRLLPPVLWYGILVEPPVVYDVAVDDFKYIRSEVPGKSWPLVYPIWTKSLMDHIAKRSGAASSIDWQYRWVLYQGEPKWAIVCTNNYGNYPTNLDLAEEMRKIWKYFKEKRGQSEMTVPLWYLGWDENHSTHVFWRRRSN